MIARSEPLAQAVWWCAVSVAWAVLAGAAALIAGLVVGSVALIGFGADSIVDGSASAVLVWRFSAESSGASHADSVERRAARLVGGILVLIGVYLTVAAAVALAPRLQVGVRAVLAGVKQVYDRLRTNPRPNNPLASSMRVPGSGAGCVGGSGAGRPLVSAST